MVDDEGPAPGESTDGEPEPQIASATDPVAIAKAREKSRLNKSAGNKFWQSVLATAVGRQEVWALLTAAHTFEERFACGPNGFPQVEATWYHAGEQAFGMRFYQSLLLIDHDAVVQMHEEHDARWIKPKRARKKAEY